MGAGSAVLGQILAGILRDGLGKLDDVASIAILGFGQNVPACTDLERRKHRERPIKQSSKTVRLYSYMDKWVWELILSRLTAIELATVLA